LSFLFFRWQQDLQIGAIWLLAILICFVLIGLAYWIVQQIVQPIKSLTDAAEAIAGGDYSHRVYVANRDELGALAVTLNRINQELSGRMTQLRHSYDRQFTVLDGMIEGVIAVDDRQRVVLANPTAGRLFGFRSSDAGGRPLLEIVRNHAVHEAVVEAIDSHTARRLQIKSNIQYPTSSILGAEDGPARFNRASSIEYPASSIQHVDIHIQPLPGEPCPGVVLVMHDTTELRHLESLRRDFMANVSHELKTPLSSIKAYTETLRDGAVHDPDTADRFLQRIEEQSDRLNHLITDMLMLARIESDQQAFEIVPVDVARVAAACVDNRRSAAEAKGISLAIAPHQPVCRVRADLEGFREILDNLIDNAIKYTPEGGSVTISWNLTPDTGSEIRRGERSTPATPHLTARIAVCDTGIGIKNEDQIRIFERFYRVDKARSRELGGTGLGLAIVKHLAQSFGGSVSVTSEPGKGSTFTVELPVV
jgi:two-component system phosphate regulon sensor histidine kinase PhoR